MIEIIPQFPYKKKHMNYTERDSRFTVKEKSMTITPPSSSPRRDIPLESVVSITNHEEKSDLDRGLEFFAEFVDSHFPDDQRIDAVKLLFDQDMQRQRQISALEKSSKRWNKTKKITLIITLSTSLYAIIADLLDQLLNPNTRRQQDVRIAIVVSAILLTAMAGAISYFAYWMQGKKNEKLKQALELHEPDIEMVKKIRAIMESWGALMKAQDDCDSCIDVNGKIKTCFKNIKKIPIETPAGTVADRNILVSATVTLLPADHPLNETIIKLATPRKPGLRADSDSSDDGSFHDIGQKTHRRHRRTNALSSCSEEQVFKNWERIEQLMDGLYVERIYAGKDNELINPMPRNCYFRGLPSQK